MIASLALLVALGGSAYAVTGGLVGHDGQIHACVARDGSLFLVKAGTRCKRGRRPIAWEQAPMHVASADTATTAVHATSADSATNASHASNADHATNADTATNATKLGGSPASAYTLNGSEGWHDATFNDGSFFGNEPSELACWWQNLGGAQNPAGYFRDPAGIVHLRGVVVAHDGTGAACGVEGGLDPIILTLPPGYQPDNEWAIATIANDKPGRVNIKPLHDIGLGTGQQFSTVEVEPGFPAFTDAKIWVSLDGITFRCAPSGQNGCP